MRKKIVKKPKARVVRKSNKYGLTSPKLLIPLLILIALVFFVGSRINSKSAHKSSNIPTPSATSTPIPSPTLSPTPTQIPTPTPDLVSTPGEIIAGCMPLDPGACDPSLFGSVTTDGVTYATYNRVNGGCAKFNLPAGIVDIYSGTYDFDTINTGPTTTNWSCDGKYYTTAGYNYLKSKGETPNGL
ncbi:MAG TPA: hypothetical protein VG917_06170 [Patescibacteria group bacterium]|nr:hypothetical protein [Patescibacteria group bacterium]